MGFNDIISAFLRLSIRKKKKQDVFSETNTDDYYFSRRHEMITAGLFITVFKLDENFI